MENKIGDDLLRQVEAIADFIGDDPRSTNNKLAKGYLPGFKEGGVWVSSKSVLREHYEQRLAGAAIAERGERTVKMRRDQPAKNVAPAHKAKGGKKKPTARPQKHAAASPEIEAPIT
jgi:hypothetical protein